jgi:hypothetical protein
MSETELIDEKYVRGKGIKKGDRVEVIGHHEPGHDKIIGMGYDRGFTGKDDLILYHIMVPGQYGAAGTLHPEVQDKDVGIPLVFIKDVVKLEVVG